MRDCECNPTYRHHWFKPLFIEMKFEEQWRELEMQIKQINNLT
jgi:hypothetical protein